MKKNYLIPLILLFVYCFSLTPSLVFHNHHASSSCKDIIDDIKNHAECSHEYNHKKEKEFCCEVDCSHESHFSQLEEDCLLCNNCAVFDHNLNIYNSHTYNSFIINQDFLFHEKICLKEVFSDNNKSPPILV